MKKYRLKIIVVLVFIVAISSFLYFDAFATLTSYESVVDGKVETTGAKFVVKINGTNVVTTDGTVENVNITSTVTGSTHVKADTIAPGSNLIIPINLNVFEERVREDVFSKCSSPAPSSKSFKRSIGSGLPGPAFQK